MRLLIGLSSLVCLFSCGSGLEDARADEACKQASYAVSSRVFACENDPKKANAAYETFSRAYTCTATVARAADFACSEGILGTACTDVAARTADDMRYVQSAAACYRILRRTDGAPIPLVPIPSRNPVCEPLLRPLLDTAQRCTENVANTHLYEPDYAGGSADADDRLRRNLRRVAAEIDAAYACVTTLTDAKACLDSISCSSAGGVTTPVAIVNASASCKAIFLPRGGTP